MANHPDKIAQALGAKRRGKVPRTGGGAFGAARMAKVLAEKLAPSSGKRPGRPTHAAWVRHPKVPMSDATHSQLLALAERISTPERRVSPMQVAAQLLEESVQRLSSNANQASPY